jgi:hypothetical protein
MFQIFLNINSISLYFIANQNGVRYSDSTSYFKKYSSSKCKQTVCLHYGLDFHFKLNSPEEHVDGVGGGGAVFIPIFRLQIFIFLLLFLPQIFIFFHQYSYSHCFRTPVFNIHLPPSLISWTWLTI